MRKVTSETVRAFVSGNAKKVGNTESTGQRLLLFGELIAEWREGEIWFTLAGCNTITTKDRLNALLSIMNAGKISTVKGLLRYNERYISDTEWVKLDR